MICTAALVAAIGISGCSDMDGGKQTTSRGVEITQQQTDNCPDGNCKDSINKDECPDGNCPNGENKDECPDGNCKDGKSKDECPDGNCPKKKKGKRGKPILPRGRFNNHRRKPSHPKLPVQPPEDDIIIPDPPVEDPTD